MEKKPKIKKRNHQLEKKRGVLLGGETPRNNLVVSRWLPFCEQEGRTKIAVGTQFCWRCSSEATAATEEGEKKERSKKKKTDREEDTAKKTQGIPL